MKPRAKPRTPLPKSAPGVAVRQFGPEALEPEDIRAAVSRLKRERIIAAAVELFYNQGYAHTTLDQVAEAIQVTKPFIYTYYKSKQALLADICARAIWYSHECVTRALDRPGTPTERLHAIAGDFMLTVLTHQSHAVVYSREEKELAPQDRDAINELRREFDHRLVALLEEGVASGDFVIEDVNLTALAIVGIAGWSQFWYRPSGRLSREQTAQRVASMVLAMAGAKTPTRSTAPRKAAA